VRVSGTRNAVHRTAQSAQNYRTSSRSGRLSRPILLTGVRPSNLLDENTYQFTWRHLCQVSTPMDNLLSKMVELMPANRYSNAKEAKKALDRLITPVSSPPVQPKPNSPPVLLKKKQN
jgi:hypothetical protein